MDFFFAVFLMFVDAQNLGRTRKLSTFVQNHGQLKVLAKGLKSVPLWDGLKKGVKRETISFLPVAIRDSGTSI